MRHTRRVMKQVLSVFLCLFATSVEGTPSGPHQQADAPALASTSVPLVDGKALVDLFLTHEEPAPLTQYRALRRLWARNERFNREARVEALTTFDSDSGFRYQILSEEGSKVVRDRALRPLLEGEARAWSDGTATRSRLTRLNYEFAAGDQPGRLFIRPRRKDALLVEGEILVSPADGDLLRIDGRLAKAPSFWTRRVDVVREYRRIAGVRVPVGVWSRAWVRIAGVSTLEMTYEYEEINGVALTGAAAPSRAR
jgi:hypothetical protein